MKAILTFCILTAAITPALTPPVWADEADGLKLPSGFHASVVAEGLGAVRHLAVRGNGDLYISTPRNRAGFGGGIVAVELDKDHKLVGTPQHFGAVDGGTGIRFYKGALYASTPSRIYRYSFHGKSLLPDPEPQVVVDGMPVGGSANRVIAFDGKGNLYVTVPGVGNICADPATPKGKPPVGLKPCPDLASRSGIWKFSATKLNQQFPTGGEQIATGIRDLDALDWSPADGALYGVMHGRDGTHAAFGALVSAGDDDAIADEMHRVTKGTDFGWPYTYYDGVKKIRLAAPEYGGDGKTAASGTYDMPVATFQGTRAAPLDMMFYTGNKFPKQYQDGAFVVLHGSGGPVSLPQGHNGYDIVFLPFGKSGKAGDPQVFADNFAGPDPSFKNGGNKAKYRPIAAAMAPDGAMYVADSNKGRVWRITYGDN